MGTVKQCIRKNVNVGKPIKVLEISLQIKMSLLVCGRKDIKKQMGLRILPLMMVT